MEINKSYWWQVLIILAILLRFILAFIAVPSGDAAWHLTVARYIATEHQIPTFEFLGRDNFWAPPLFHLIAAVFYSIGNLISESVAEITMKLVSPLASSLLIVLTYSLVKQLKDEKTAKISSLLVAYIPISISLGVQSYVDSTLALFVTLSVYLMLQKRIIFSALAASLAIQTKFTGIFILPLLIYLLLKGEKDIVSSLKSKRTWVNIAHFTLIAFLVGLPWFVRNAMVFGNPFWPFLIQLLGGVNVPFEAHPQASLSNLRELDYIPQLYFEFFGVPNGHIENLFFFDIPRILIVLWIIGIILFTIPFILGMIKYIKRLVVKKEHTDIVLTLWCVGFVVMITIYIYEIGGAYFRLLFPLLVPLTLLWVEGYSSISPRIPQLSIFLLTLLFIAGFSSGEITKTLLAKQSWEVYEPDYEWIRENTPKESIIFYLGQTLSYHAHRRVTFPPRPLKNEENLYIWVNQNLRLEIQSILPSGMLQEIQSHPNNYLVYNNTRTGTLIYKTQQ